MIRFHSLRLPIFIWLVFVAHPAEARLCNPIRETCTGYGGRSASKPAYPTTGSSINLNPSAVPVRDALGGEIIFYDGSLDFSLVKGTGRIGAAISPSNSEETFFGPLGLETEEEYVIRKSEGRKFRSPKYTLATAFSLYDNKKKGLKRFDLNVGAMGRYNELTRSVHPGGGVSGVAGPFTFGYSYYTDDFLEEPTREKVRYDVRGYSAGIYLSSFALDYSVLETSDEFPSMISIYTGSLLLRRGIFTLSYRSEDSDRRRYNYETKSLEAAREKGELFGAAQLVITETSLIGCYYNYYLLHELSLGLTIFF